MNLNFLLESCSYSYKATDCLNNMIRSAIEMENESILRKTEKHDEEIMEKKQKAYILALYKFKNFCLAEKISIPIEINFRDIIKLGKD